MSTKTLLIYVGIFAAGAAAGYYYCKNNPPS